MRKMNRWVMVQCADDTRKTLDVYVCVKLAADAGDELRNGALYQQRSNIDVIRKISQQINRRRERKSS